MTESFSAKKVDTSLSNSEGVYDFLTDITNSSEILFGSALPDCQLSKRGIVSAVLSVEDAVVPQFLPSVMNCGMAVFKINVLPATIEKNSSVIVSEIHRQMQTNSWELDPKQRVAVLQGGAPAFADKFLTETEVELDKMLCGGKSNLDYLIDQPLEIDEIVPTALLEDMDLFRMPDNRIRSNHFIEFYEKRSISDRKENSNQSNTLCAFHMESKFSEFLNKFYVSPTLKDIKKDLRSSIRGLKMKGVNTISRSLRNGVFHAKNGSGKTVSSPFPNHPVALGDTTLSVDSDAGQRYLAAHKFGFNHSAAARLAQMEVIVLAMEDVLERELECELIWEAGHDNIIVEEVQGSPHPVSRIGATPVGDLDVGFVAGSPNSPSLLMERTQSEFGHIDSRWRGSYDHGMGRFLDGSADNSGSHTELGEVAKFRASGKSVSANIEESKESVYFTDSVQEYIDIYIANDAPAQPAELLSPIGPCLDA